jgi:hypothetical protein
VDATLAEEQNPALHPLPTQFVVSAVQAALLAYDVDPLFGLEQNPPVQPEPLQFAVSA